MVFLNIFVKLWRKLIENLKWVIDNEILKSFIMVISLEIHHRYDALNCKTYTEVRSMDFIYWVYESQTVLKVSTGLFKYPRSKK